MLRVFQLIFITSAITNDVSINNKSRKTMSTKEIFAALVNTTEFRDISGQKQKCSILLAEELHLKLYLRLNSMKINVILDK